MKKESEEVNGKSIMGLMMLAAGQGSKLQIRCEGPDAEQRARRNRRTHQGDASTKIDPHAVNRERNTNPAGNRESCDVTLRFYYGSVDFIRE